MNQKTIRTNDIVSVFITFVDSNDGKKRPALVLKVEKESLTILRLTTKYKNKSNKIKAQYYPIKDWQEAGLVRKSYIDVGSVIQIDKTTQKKVYKIGSLTTRDIKCLSQFITNYL